MKDIKTKDDIKNSWLIEEIYSNENCRHAARQYSMNGEDYIETLCTKSTPVISIGISKCKKETCPLRVK